MLRNIPWQASLTGKKETSEVAHEFFPPPTPPKKKAVILVLKSSITKKYQMGETKQ
jgi:hypothetical protein